MLSVRGALNFFGERQTQSHFPDMGLEPEVSIFISKPAFFKAVVKASKLYSKGSPPVIMANLAGCAKALVTISSIDKTGCLLASQLSFTSHQTQPTSQPAKRMK